MRRWLLDPVHRRGFRLAAAVSLALVASALLLRFGAQTPAGQSLLISRLDGLSLGSIGRLHIEGVKGDIWRDFKIRRLEVIDAKGPWLDARGVAVRWRWIDLLRRRVHLQSVSADIVQIERRPMIVPTTTAPSQPPVSLIIDDLKTRIETWPAFSGARGLYQTTLKLALWRSGGVKGTVAMTSLLHPGDGLQAQVSIGVDKRLLLDAQAREGRGGALGGALGLPAGQTFLLDAHLAGDPTGGKLHLRALTGERPIAQADGAWNPGGGGGTGRLSLAASSLSAWLLREFGPELKISGHGRGLGEGLYDVVVQAGADNATLSASGVVDPAKAATHGDVRLSGGVHDLTRIVAAPAMGAATMDGRLAGSLGAWRLAGRIGVDRLKLDGYSLSRAAGPFDLRYANRELRLQSTLDGAGGQGQGLLAQAAGGHPKLSAELSRLPDGRVLLRALKADGDGLHLDAVGEVALFGALKFKGDLQFANLASTRHGAKGGLAAHWTADQRKSGDPWAFTLDALGADLASGSPELDRLLGPKPRLQIDATLKQGAVTVVKSDLRGAAGNAQASGLVAKDGGLALTLKWAAHGPFDLGPLEATGEAAGSGTVKGSLAEPHADLLADFQRIDLPGLSLKPAHVALSFIHAAAGTDGRIAVTAGSDDGPAHASAGFRFASGAVELTNIDAAAGGATANGAVSLRRLAPSSADLKLTVGPGAFAAQGRADASLKIVDAPSGPAGDLTLTMSDFILRNSTLSVARAQIVARGPLAKMPYTVTGEAVAAGVPVRLSGSGVAMQAAKGYAVSFSGSGRVRRADFNTVSPALVDFGGEDLAARLNLALGGGHLDLDARQTGDGLDAKLNLIGVDVAALGEDLAGRVNADLSLKGRGATLDGVLNAHLDGARSRDAPAKLGLAGDVHAVLSGDRITIAAVANGVQAGDKAQLDLTLPAAASATPFRIAVDRTRPIEGRIETDSELQPIWDLFFGGDRELGGRFTARATVGGTLNDPKFAGAATLAQGRFEDAATGLKLRNLAADVQLRQDAVDVQRFSASDANGGQISGQGSTSLIKGGASTLTLKARGFRLLDNDTAKVVTSGDVTVVRDAAGKAKLTGALSVDRADISAVSTRRPAGVVALDVVERNTPVSNVAQSAPASGRIPPVTLDIRIRAPGRVFVRGLGLNAEMSLAATVSGTVGAPVLSGTAHVVRGDYDLAGQRFQIDDSGVVYLATSPNDIRLDLSATREAPTLTAVVKIHGTAAKPEITLTSTPTLPSDEVLSQVLFGTSASQLSPVEAAQLAATVASLATGGGFDVMSGLRNFARLDRLALGGGDAASGVTVSGGKYIGDKVYLELTGGGRLGPSAQVEVRANRNLSFISQIGGEAGAKLSVRWKVNYGRPKKEGK